MTRMLALLAALGLSPGALTAAAPATSFHASRVVGYVGGSGYELFPHPDLALGGPRGLGSGSGSLHCVSLGEQGHIVLGFQPGQALADDEGEDLIVFENPFGSAHAVFGELVRVGVSTDGADYAFFDTRCALSGPIGPYEMFDPAAVQGFAGVGPVHANVELSGSPDPFDPAVAGGDAFDLADLADHPLVTTGAVDLGRIYYVKLVDVLGDGTEQDDGGPPNPIYDPTGEMDPDHGGYRTSADVDAISVVHGLPAPTGGDANRDGLVDVLDLAALANNFGASPATWEQGDFGGDGLVDVLDLAVLANHFGEGPSPPMAPEPSAAWLLLLAAGARRRRRRRADRMS